MGAKGQRRREKNYQAAHGGGNTRLPPPPDPSSLDAMPSKLRKLMSLAGFRRFPFSLHLKSHVYMYIYIYMYNINYLLFVCSVQRVASVNVPTFCYLFRVYVGTEI